MDWFTLQLSLALVSILKKDERWPRESFSVDPEQELLSFPPSFIG
jgi:hypothetical protein